MKPQVTVVALCLLAVAIYVAGLHGPYLLDDFSVLSPIEYWHAGRQSWLATLLPNADSVVFSRPVAMASFMLTTWMGGVGTFPLKSGNLAIHLICGLLVWQLLKRLLKLDFRLAPQADLIAVIATAFWLLHPLHVSTVLYAVQRMAQLATLFTLAAVIVYLVARQQLASNRRWPAIFNFFLSFPLLMGLGLLSKQNAAIAGILCLVVEIAYFQGTARPRVVQGFFGLFVALPTLMVLLILAVTPERLLAGYAEWDFTLWQRLLTQPRVLCDYIGMWFLPRGPQMGLYTDAYLVSTGLLSPPSTLLAILALAAVSMLAIVVRKRAPSVFAGWFFFLVAHAVESSFLPIEMYYEHRNYLPAFGLLLMAFGLLGMVPDAAWARMANPRRLGLVAASAIVLTLAFATFGRVLVWQHEETIIAQGIEQHPESLRARLDMASLALRGREYADAAGALAPFLESRDSRHRYVARMGTLAINCARGGRVDLDLLSTTAAQGPAVITVHEVFLAKLLVQAHATGLCTNIPPEVIASALDSLLAGSSGQAEFAVSRSSVRLAAAQMHAHAGQWVEAERHAATGWQGHPTLALGAVLVQASLESGHRERAERTLEALTRMTHPGDIAGQRRLAELRHLLDKG